MPKYQLDIPHTLAPEEAKQRIADATGKLSTDYGATCTWKSDNELAVSRKGLDARVMLEPSRVRIDMNLGFLMTPFAELIKTGITKKLTAILTDARLTPACGSGGVPAVGAASSESESRASSAAARAGRRPTARRSSLGAPRRLALDACRSSDPRAASRC